MATILSIRNVTKYKRLKSILKKNKKIILNNVSFNLYEKEIFFLFGENLSGKSSLGKSILKLSRIDSGEIIYKNENILKFNRKQIKNLKKDIHIIFQHSKKFINPTFTVLKVITEMLEKKLDLSTMDYFFHKLDLSKDILDKNIFDVNKQELEKIMLIRTIIVKPRILIIDEPSSNLDYKNKEKIIEFLKEIKIKYNMSIFIISNDIKFGLDLADRIAIIYNGEILEIASKSDNFNFIHPYSKIVMKNINEIYINKINNNIANKNLCPFINNCPDIKKICLKEKPIFKEHKKEQYFSCFID